MACWMPFVKYMEFLRRGEYFASKVKGITPTPKLLSMITRLQILTENTAFPCLLLRKQIADLTRNAKIKYNYRIFKQLYAL